MIIDGKLLANQIKQTIKDKVAKMKVKPGLAVILVGEDPASQVYVNSKEKACQEVGFYSQKIVLPKNTDQAALIKQIEKLNQDKKIQGILVQLPLPKQIDEGMVVRAISPQKDVDCFHPQNVGRLALLDKNPNLDELLAPCTPKGVMRLLENAFSASNLTIVGSSLRSTDSKFFSSNRVRNNSNYPSGQRRNAVNKKKENFEQSPRELNPFLGKKAVVVGRSNLTGKPTALLLLAMDATVTICHSKTSSLIEETKKADILVVAVGRPKFITGEMVKKGAVVIDVGINRTEKGLVGDVDFESVNKVAGFITPVPGGVGPMTIACLLENTLLLARKNYTC